MLRLRGFKVCGDEAGAQVRSLGVHGCHPRQQHVVWDRCGVPSALMLLVAVDAVAAGDVGQH